jgi:GNAT superfamily N-acetyltransferase
MGSERDPDSPDRDPAGPASRPDEAIVVRPVRPEEYQRLADLTLAAYLEIEGVAGEDDYIEELSDVAGRAAKVPVLVAVDETDGTVLGGVAYIPGPGPLAEQERPDEAGFRMLAVSPHAQGRGIGRLLVEACVARARQDRKRRIVLLTLPTMRSAHRLYEHLGFERDPANDWEYAPGHLLLAYALVLSEGAEALG